MGGPHARDVSAPSSPLFRAAVAGSPLGGSNAFAISGRVSASGNALLMGEFHMEVGRFPPVVYASHVAYADGTFYQGLGIPGFAWNSSGRNDTCAFSCTFGHGDNVDIIADRCKDEKHLVGEEWKPLVRRVERLFQARAPDLAPAKRKRLALTAVEAARAVMQFIEVGVAPSARTPLRTELRAMLVAYLSPWLEAS